MTWYKAFYGTWADGDTVTQIDFGKYCYGTYSRQEAFSKAQETANETGRTVTVLWGTPSAKGLVGSFKEVFPE